MTTPAFDPFELRLASGMRADADASIPHFDPAVVAEAAIRRSPGRGRRHWLHAVLNRARPTARVSFVLVILALVLIVVGTIAAGAVVLRQPEPAPAPTTMFTDTGAFGASDGDTAVRLTDGRVLIVGEEAALWDPATGLFTAIGQNRSGRDWPIAVLLSDGKVLTAGGSQAGQPLASAELFDPVTEAFNSTGSMLEARGTCLCAGTEYRGGVMTLVTYAGLQRPTGVALDDGRVFVVGGGSSNTGAEIYDPRTGAFTRAGHLEDLERAPEGQDPPCTADRVTAVALRDGRVLVKCINSAFLYDPASDAFTLAGAPVTDSVGVALVLRDGRVLFAGGGRLGSDGRAEIYDPTTGAFSAVDDTTDASAGWPRRPAVVLADGRVAFVGRTVVLVFDPTTESFSQLKRPLPRLLGSATATLLRDGLVLITGPGESYPEVGPQQLLNPAGS
jgi:hypothetical protein